MSDIDVPPFYLDSLIAHVPGSVAPVTEFPNGAQIELVWDSNGTSYTVYAGGEADPVYSGTAPTCVVPGRSRNTTFVVVASVAGGPDSGTPNPGFQTVQLSASLTVTIRDPDQTPKSVTAGTLDVTGTTTLKSDATVGPTVVGGTLDVTGTSTLEAGATATGLTVTGTSNLQGQTNLKGTTVSGPLTVTGNVEAGGANVVGSLTVNTSVTMFAPRAISTGQWYSATTDGLLVGTVWWPSGGAGLRCCAIINGYGQGVGWVYATGGNTVVHADTWSTTMWNNANTYTVPVMRGTSFQANATQIGDKAADAPTSFWWYPMGRNATLTELTDDEAVALGAPAGPPPLLPATPPAYDPGNGIVELVEVLRDVLGGNLSERDERRFSDALWSMVQTGPRPPEH